MGLRLPYAGESRGHERALDFYKAELLPGLVNAEVTRERTRLEDVYIDGVHRLVRALRAWHEATG
jgi:hypothetical protein